VFPGSPDPENTFKRIILFIYQAITKLTCTLSKYLFVVHVVANTTYIPDTFNPIGNQIQVVIGLLIGCEKYWAIMWNFQEVTFCSRNGLLCSKLCDFSGEDFS